MEISLHCEGMQVGDFRACLEVTYETYVLTGQSVFTLATSLFTSEYIKVSRKLTILGDRR